MFQRLTLKVGDVYLIGTNVNNLYPCIFIKSTPKGYNFLNLRTLSVQFKSHFYPTAATKGQKIQTFETGFNTIFSKVNDINYHSSSIITGLKKQL